MKVPITDCPVSVVLEVGMGDCPLDANVEEAAVRVGEGELEIDPVEFKTCCGTVDGDFTLKIGINEKTHRPNAIGPATFSHLFSPKLAGILNNPKSEPEKYGARKRMKEKTSNTTPKGSGIPANLMRLDLSIENSRTSARTGGEIRGGDRTPHSSD
jgi:hypothetical protein